MIRRYLYIEGINPEPWTAPDVTVGRARGGRTYPIVSSGARQKAYQAAIRESITQGYPELFPIDMTKLRVQFFFWRQLDSYTAESGRKASRNVADATNIQKATEDALQGLLFTNDRWVKNPSSLIVAEGPDVEPCIIVLVSDLDVAALDYAETVRERLANSERPAMPGNIYIGGGELWPR